MTITQTPNLAATTRLDAYHKQLYDVMNGASQRSGGLGSRLDAMQFDGAALVTAGALVSRKYLEYTIQPVLGSTTTIHAAIALTALAQAGYAITTNPDVPRVINVTGNASGITGNVVIHGTDFLGASISDTIALSGSSTVAGVKAFATVTSVDLPAQTHAGTDTVAIGVSTTIVGLPAVLPYASYMLIELFNGSADGGSTAVNAAISQNLYTASGTFDGTKKLVLVFVA